MSEVVLKQLAQHYQQQLHCYRQFFTLTQKLLAVAQAIQHDREEEAVTLIRQRQKLLDIIEQQQRAAQPLWQALKKQWGYKPTASELPSIYSEPSAAKIAKVYIEIQQLLQQILSSDAVIREAMESICQKLQRNLHNLHQGRQVTRSYATPQKQNEGIFIDSKKC